MTAPADPQVIFTPSGRRGRVAAGTTVLDAARSLGVDIDSVCGGRGICGRCAVTPAFGEFAKHGITSAPGHLSEAGEVEAAYRAEHGLAADRRLSCTAHVLGDAVVDVPPESQVHRQVVRKDLDARPFVLDPVVRLHTVDVVPPDLATPTGDLGRLFDALATEWDLHDLRADLAVIRALQPALTKGDYRVTVAVHGGRDVIAVWPGFHDRAFGVAIDIGSTTIAGHLANLTDGSILASAGVMNPQIRFGEDLMSRVSYVMMHEGGDRELTEAVRKALDGLLATLANRAGIKRVEILELALVGNPIMHHLLLGIDPTPLGSAPFALAVDTAVELPAAELGLRTHPGARVYVLPCIAGHVGADTAGVILAEEPHLGRRPDPRRGRRHERRDRPGRQAPAAGRLVADGPGVRGRPDQRRAARRARRHRARPDRPRDARAAVPGHRRGRLVRCPGLRRAARCGRRRRHRHLRLRDHRGRRRAVPRGRHHGRRRHRWRDGGADAARRGRRSHLQLRAPRSGRGRAGAATGDALGLRILVTQNDVRAIQLAKAALYAGVRLLMDQLGVDAVDEVRLAGAFGSQIDPLHAMVLGLVPDCDLARVRGAGNAAGTGALIALLSGAARREIEAVVRRVEKIETAVEPRFQEHFVEAMAIPHRTAGNPHLERAVTLPARREAGSADRGADPRAERRRRRAVISAGTGTGEDR